MSKLSVTVFPPPVRLTVTVTVVPPSVSEGVHATAPVDVSTVIPGGTDTAAQAMGALSGSLPTSARVKGASSVALCVPGLTMTGG